MLDTKENSAKFESLLSTIDVCITYSPLLDEPNPFLCENIAKRNFPIIENIPPHGKRDPREYAVQLTDRFRGARVCILVPGQKFDAQGNRKGRGGGWYDRFLASVSREWVRIGVPYEKQLSPVPLKKNPWDEPMDLLLVHKENSWRLIRIPGG